MEENAALPGIFHNMYDGKPWTEVRLREILAGIHAEDAARRLIPGANTIWQILQHCTAWRAHVLDTLKGIPHESPADNYLTFPEDISEEAWNELLRQGDTMQKDWEEFIETMEPGFTDHPYGNGYSNYDVIHGIMHHDNYHFGQIVMLKKLL